MEKKKVTKKTSSKKLMPALICTGTNGRCVIFGMVESIPDAGQPVRIYEPRMVFRWGGTGGIFDLATNGPTSDSRITVAAPETVCEVKQALACTNEARAKFNAHPAMR